MLKRILTRRRRRAFVIGVALNCATSVGSARVISEASSLQTTPATMATVNPDDKMNAFITQLMERMTLEEKAGQLVQYTADMAVTGNTVRPQFRKDIVSGRVGSILNAYTPKFTRELQQLAVEKTRLKIPLLFGYDVIHGHRTIFPIPLGESASWNPKLMEQTAAVSAREAAADGIHWTFAPMVDVSRDPRWGRVAEGAGEDPWLGAKIATARVRGLQGDQIGATDRVLACVKHFAAYGAPLGGREYATVDMSERELFENYLPPYEAAIRAGAATVMTAFNEISGVPSTSNRWLLKDYLRKQLGFKGLVVTDYNAVQELIPHGVAKDNKDAGRLAFNAGVDMDMMAGIFDKELPVLAREGRVKLSDIDVAVRRVLELKYKLGLFEDPYRFSSEARAKTVMLAPEHRRLAREAARESMVLLKNAKSILPLKRRGHIAVIGPFARNTRDVIGSWSAAGVDVAAHGTHPVSLLEGLRAVAGAGVEISDARGANLFEDPALLNVLNEHGGKIEPDRRPREELLSEARALAARADVIVLALGEAQGMSGEAASRTRIRLPEPQQDLLRAMKATGKPVVAVLFNGRPLALELENELADALLEAWFPGTESGHAVADILFGDYNPSGKLTATFPRNEGQIPIFYAEKNTGRPNDGSNTKYRSMYQDVPNAPLFPFGYGLSYSEFKYGRPKLSKKSLHTQDQLEVRVSVKNVSRVPGEEIAQLYIRDVVASVTRPVLQLRGFEKLRLAPGEEKIVRFELSANDLKFYDARMQLVSEPGEFKVFVGGNSANLKEASFELLPDAAPIQRGLASSDAEDEL